MITGIIIIILAALVVMSLMIYDMGKPEVNYRGKIKQFFCRHDFYDRPFYDACRDQGFDHRFSDIVYHKCKKCDWWGFR